LPREEAVTDTQKSPGITAGAFSFHLKDQEGTTAACPLIARSTSSRLATAYIA